jgi:hypothetical protein
VELTEEAKPHDLVEFLDGKMRLAATRFTTTAASASTWATMG